MIHNHHTLQNSILLTQFEDLQAQGKNPQLGAYRGKNLMIISYQTNGLQEKISSIFTAALINLYKLFNLLSTNNITIEELKNEVYNFHLSKAQVHRQADLQRLQEAARQITQENENLNQNKNQLLSQISNLEERKRVVDQEKARVEADFQPIQQEYLLARSAIQQKQAVEQETIRLENDIASLRRKKEALLPAQTELADLQRQISALNAERNQLQDQSKQRRINSLETDIKKLEKTLYRIRCLANDATSHTRNPNKVEEYLAEICRFTYC